MKPNMMIATVCGLYILIPSVFQAQNTADTGNALIKGSLCTPIRFTLTGAGPRGDVRFDDGEIAVVCQYGDFRRTYTVVIDSNVDPARFVITQDGPIEGDVTEEKAGQEGVRPLEIEGYYSDGTIGRPTAYQWLGKRRIDVEAHFARIAGTNLIRLRVGEYDPAFPLIVSFYARYFVATQKESESSPTIKNKH